MIKHKIRSKIDEQEYSDVKQGAQNRTVADRNIGTDNNGRRL